MFKPNDIVQIKPRGYNKMIGRVDTIIKIKSPLAESSNPNDWKVMVYVENDLFCIPYNEILIFDHPEMLTEFESFLKGK